jgi:MoaA/NifB/PqqE/SkfB family radical SAM enzyme
MSLITFISILYSHLRNTCRLLAGATPIPYKWLIQLTNDCNSRCESCDIWKINKNDPAKKSQESSLTEYQNLFQTSGKHLRWLSLSGGEITLFQNIRELALLVKKNCPNLRIITFTTNGLNPEKILEIAGKLQGLAADMFIVISLDGDEELHDKLRGVPGNYEKAQKSFQFLKDAGFTVYFGTTLNNSNRRWIEKNAEKLKSVSLIHSDGIYEKRNQIDDVQLAESLQSIVKNYKIKSMSELGEYFYLKLGIQFLKGGRKKIPVSCDSLNSSLHISPYGEIKPCMYLPAIGNIKKSTIEECLSSDEAARMREKIAKELCPKCWMNCYAPHSIMQHPFQTIKALTEAN